MTDKITSIRVRESTRNRIASYGQFGDSMEDILIRLCNFYDDNNTSK